MHRFLFAVIALICLSLCGCGYRCRCAPGIEPHILRVALDINEDKDLAALAKLYGEPPIVDLKADVVAYRASYDLHDEAILELLCFDFEPVGREVWWMVIHYDRTDGQPGRYETFMTRCAKVMAYDIDKKANVWNGEFRLPEFRSYDDIAGGCRLQSLESVAAALSTVR